jgi:RecB family exonuclease
MNISSISVSRKDTFDQCHLLYKYKYHDKLPSPEPEPFYFIYGKIIHTIAEELVLSKGERTIGKITEQVLGREIPIDTKLNGEPVYAPKLPQEYRTRMPQHLKSLQKLTEQVGTDGIVEHEFLYDLDPPNKIIARGYIDRILSKNDKIFIFDYKTSKNNGFRKTVKNVGQDLQLRLYARVVQRQFNVAASSIVAGLVYLEDFRIIGARFSEESLSSAEKSMKETFVTIKNMPPEEAKANVGDHCRRCDYRSICPAYRAFFGAND